MADSGKAIRTLCQRCGQWRENVNPETDWICRECGLEAQVAGLLVRLEGLRATRAEARAERDEARSALDHAIVTNHNLQGDLDASRALGLVERRERDEALKAMEEAQRQGDALQTSLLQAGRDVEEAHAAAAGYCRKVIQTREVARWLLAEWGNPENWAEAIAAAEAKFGMLDWLREGRG